MDAKPELENIPSNVLLEGDAGSLEFNRDLTPRQRKIIGLLTCKGMATVNEAAETFGVTPQSVRKDFELLSRLHLVERIHGGAVLKTGFLNLQYQARVNIAKAEKQAIGKLVASLIPDNVTLFLNIGTTTEEVAKNLMNHQNLLVITNNLNVVNILRANPNLSIICSNGLVRHDDGGIVGEQASQFMSQFKADFAVIGTSSIDAEGHFLDYDFREVSVTKNLIRSSRKVILTGDSTKFERNAPVIVGDMRDVDFLVTNEPPPPAFRKIAEEHSVSVLYPKTKTKSRSS